MHPRAVGFRTADGEMTSTLLRLSDGWLLSRAPALRWLQSMHHEVVGLRTIRSQMRDGFETAPGLAVHALVRKRFAKCGRPRFADLDGASR